MARRPERRAGGPRQAAINPTLYGLLSARIGPVEISNEGAHAVFGTPQYSVRRGRVESQLIDEGEYYRVSCPYCNDTTKRLYVNHLWLADDPVNGEPMRHLAICYNEGCLERHYRAFEERVVGMLSQRELEAMRRQRAPDLGAVEPELAPLGPVLMPGVIVPLDELPPDHRAVAYLRDRGFDPAELAARWGVGFCLSAEGMYPGIARRIFVPVVFNGEMVGWQGRWPSDDWKRAGVQKYYNLKAFRKTWVLYNHDRALECPYVVVQEGVTDVWATGDGAVATLGKTISPAQRGLLAAWAAKRQPDGLLVLMLDPEAWTAEQRDPEKARVKHDMLLAELHELFDGRVVEAQLPPGRDPGTFDRDTLRRLIRQQVKAAGFSPRKYGL